MSEQQASPLRLRKKHGEGRAPDVTAEDGARLLRKQSLRRAIMAGLITFIVFCIAWVLLASVTGRVYAWMTVVLGAALGFAIRYAGRGLDWRFPVLAAGMAIGGAVVANIGLAASTTAAE